MTRLLLLSGALVLAASPAFTQPSSQPKFDAADVHTAAPNPEPNAMHGGALRGGRYEIRNATMLDLIRTAYGVPAEKVAGGPNWLELNRWDIAALAAPTTSPADLRQMLQALLADRFRLVLREDKQQMAGYILKTSSAKPKLRPAGDAATNCQGSPQQQANGTVLQHMVCKSVTMAMMTERLPQMAGAYFASPLVADETGLAGAWDFELDWTPRAQLTAAGAEGVTIQKALENIGLKLDEGKIATSAYVVDSVAAAPTPNAADIATRLRPSPPPEFEVAELKPSPPDAQGPRAQLLPTGQINASAVPLRLMMTLAWNLPDDYIVGPKWLEASRYDLVAKAYATPVTNAEVDEDLLLLMLRQMVIDRFAMKFHMENRPANAFVLTADKPKMTKADPASRTRCVNTAAANRNPVLTRLITCQNVTMAQFAGMLPTVVNNYITAPVADMTGLEGTWDFTINYSPQNVFQQGRGGDAGGAGAAATAPNGALSIFEAIDRQLGLKLEPQKRPMPVMVIDSISEKPTVN